METTIPERPWGLNHFWPGTAPSQAAIGYCCLHAGLTLEDCVLHSQDQMGIVVSRQVHPIECRVGLRSAEPIPRTVSGWGIQCQAGPGWSRAGCWASRYVEKCREKLVPKNPQKLDPATRLGPVLAGGCLGRGAGCQLPGRPFYSKKQICSFFGSGGHSLRSKRVQEHFPISFVFQIHSKAAHEVTV